MASACSYVGEAGAELPYAPGVFYASDAFEGLEIIDALIDGARRPPFVERVKREALAARETAGSARGGAGIGRGRRASTRRFRRAGDDAPFWGPRVLDRVAVEDVAKYLDHNALYRGRWGGVAHGDEYERLVREEFAPRLERLLREARGSAGVSIPARSTATIRRASRAMLCWCSIHPTRHGCWSDSRFPRQPDGERLCLADYFATESGEPRGRLPGGDDGRSRLAGDGAHAGGGRVLRGVLPTWAERADGRGDGRLRQRARLRMS